MIRIWFFTEVKRCAKIKKWFYCFLQVNDHLYKYLFVPLSFFLYSQSNALQLSNIMLKIPKSTFIANFRHFDSILIFKRIFLRWIVVMKTFHRQIERLVVCAVCNDLITTKWNDFNFNRNMKENHSHGTKWAPLQSCYVQRRNKPFILHMTSWC